MNITNSQLQYLYQGYLKTPLLWNSNKIHGLHQIQFNYNLTSVFNRSIIKQLRLGQLAEQFVFNELDQVENCNILVENIQIQKEKQTLGELDALIELNNDRIHLEIVYKFYLYDETLGNTEVDRWIGPNRNDSLIEKINKLKNKQLPLLHLPECNSILKPLNLNAKDFLQRVLFKAQLFIPYKKSVVFKQLNKDCVCGFYINKQQLEDFTDSMFYMPSKLDWLLDVNPFVDWLDFEAFRSQFDTFLKQKRSPLIWIKTPDSNVTKCFLVWW